MRRHRRRGLAVWHRLRRARTLPWPVDGLLRVDRRDGRCRCRSLYFGRGLGNRCSTSGVQVCVRLFLSRGALCSDYVTTLACKQHWGICGTHLFLGALCLLLLGGSLIGLGRGRRCSIANLWRRRVTRVGGDSSSGRLCWWRHGSITLLRGALNLLRSLAPLRHHLGAIGPSRSTLLLLPLHRLLAWLSTHLTLLASGHHLLLLLRIHRTVERRLAWMGAWRPHTVHLRASSNIASTTHEMRCLIRIHLVSHEIHRVGRTPRL